MPKATIDDVAELAGVSIKTVSRVVNQEPNVREATRAKVEAAIAKLNYQPNKAARNLASHHSHLIGLIYDDPSYYEIPSAGYVIRMQQGALGACHASNYELLIHPCQYRKKDIGNEIKTLIEQVRPDGIVLAAPLSNMPKIVRAIEATATPLVRLSPGTRNGKQLTVVTNDREISAEMTRYLASLGHTRIAFITGHPSAKAVGNRYLGYLDGLEQSGLKLSERLVMAGDNSIGSGEECALQLLKLTRPLASSAWLTGSASRYPMNCLLPASTISRSPARSTRRLPRSTSRCRPWRSMQLSRSLRPFGASGRCWAPRLCPPSCRSGNRRVRRRTKSLSAKNPQGSPLYTLT
jgi:LacI family transcriptional regulator